MQPATLDHVHLLRRKRGSTFSEESTQAVESMLISGDSPSMVKFNMCANVGSGPGCRGLGNVLFKGLVGDSASHTYDLVMGFDGSTE
jgi:hypothetical protein